MRLPIFATTMFMVSTGGTWAGFLDDIVYDSEGKRIGFTSTTRPLPVYKETGKGKKHPADKAGPRFEPPLPDLGFDYSTEDFEEFLRKGQATL